MRGSAIHSLVLLTMLVASPATMRGADLPATARAMALAREGAAAAEEKDFPSYLAKMEQAVALRPDYPRMLVNLAAAQVANNQLEEAVATLDRLAALGVNSPVDKSADFAPLKGRKDFDAVLKKIAGNLVAKGMGTIAFSLPGVTGLIEGIAWRGKTGQFFFGDVNGRAVWVRQGDGTLARFTPAGDELYGVFGLAVDEARGALWAATSAVAAMRGFSVEMDGTAALAEIDLDSGAVRRVIPVGRGPGDKYSHVLGDLTVGSDGSVYLPDSGGPMIWRLSPNGAALEALVESPEFMSLQGVVALPDGDTLVVSDYPNGLLAVSIGSRAVRRLEPPENTTLTGVDGLVLAPNGDILAIQNGVRPNRILRISLGGAAEQINAVKILESGHINMPAPSLGCIATDGNFFYVGNAAWTRFEGTDGAPTAPRLVPIFRTRL